MFRLLLFFLLFSFSVTSLSAIFVIGIRIDPHINGNGMHEYLKSVWGMIKEWDFYVYFLPKLLLIAFIQTTITKILFPSFRFFRILKSVSTFLLIWFFWVLFAGIICSFSKGGW